MAWNWTTRLATASGLRKHVDETSLMAVACAGDDRSVLSGADRDHLEACPACRGRVARAAAALAAWSDDAALAADALFSQTHLDRQRDVVLRRIALDGQPARVIAFPLRRAHAPVVRRVARRWVAAAAAAGLCLGLLTGRALVPMTDSLDYALNTSPQRRPALDRLPADPVVQQTAGLDAHQVDELFLHDLDMAIAAPRIAPLEVLDALTPQQPDSRR
jgi:hypothetical protein